MSIELARDQPLFDRALNIQVVHGVAEPRVVSLVFRVLSGTRATGQSASGQSERLFHFEVRSLAFSALLRPPPGRLRLPSPHPKPPPPS